MLKVILCEAEEVTGCEPPYFDALSREVLAQGSCMRFKAGGQSMHPFIQNGDILLIQPRSTAELNTGDIVFYRRPSGRYIVHRLIHKNGSAYLITKGDNLRYYDEPVPVEQVLGRLIQIESRGKRVVLTTVPGAIFSWLLAWLSRGHYPNQTRLIRNLGRLWWLVGGRRIA